MMEYGYMGMVWVIVSHGLTLYGGGVLRLGFMYAVRFLDMSCLVLFCGVFVSLLSLFADLPLSSSIAPPVPDQQSSFPSPDI